jgi:hypothetical protein
MGYSGTGGKLIHEKNQKQKTLLHCPFKGVKTLIIPSLQFAIEWTSERMQEKVRQTGFEKAAVWR